MSDKVTVAGDLTLKEGVTKEQIDEIIKRGREVFEGVGTYEQVDDTLVSIYGYQDYWDEDCKDFYKAISKYLKDGEISFRGQDNEVWKHVFNGERWQEYTGKVIYTNPTVIASEESVIDDGEQEYLVPFAYERYGHIVVKAESPEMALNVAEDKVKEMSAEELDANSEYLPDSEEIDREGVLRYGDGSLVPDWP